MGAVLISRRVALLNDSLFSTCSILRILIQIHDKVKFSAMYQYSVAHFPGNAGEPVIPGGNDVTWVFAQYI